MPEDRETGTLPPGVRDQLRRVAARVGGAPGTAPPGVGRPATGRPGPKPSRRRRWPKVLALVLVAAVVVAAVGVALGYRYTSHLLLKGKRPVAGLTSVPPGGPENVLLVGSDSRAGLSQSQLNRIQTTGVQGQRTDTIILIHLSPGQRKAVMVSIPRDLKVTINGHTDKINSAYALGGPSLTVKTVQQLTGVPINHYVEVDFAGFLKVVDAVGGVRLCNPTSHDWNDQEANLHMKANTCANMDGVHALAYVRARHIDSDFGRIGRQQAFLRALMGKISAGGNLINLPKLVKIANIVSDHVHSDQGLSTGEALSLLRRIGRMSSSDVDMRLYPSYDPGPQCRGCADFVLAAPEAAILMNAIARNDRTLPPVGLPDGRGVTLRGVPIEVRNGSGVAGAARRTAAALRQLGFEAASDGNAASGPTTVAYPARLAEQARLLASLLGPDVRLVQRGAGSQLVLTLGKGFKPPGSG
jgi:LCP family protein required for cell wall assembly